MLTLLFGIPSAAILAAILGVPAQQVATRVATVKKIRKKEAQSPPASVAALGIAKTGGYCAPPDADPIIVVEIGGIDFLCVQSKALRLNEIVTTQGWLAPQALAIIEDIIKGQPK